MEAARRRLLSVADRERARAAQELRTGVIAALDRAAAELAGRVRGDETGLAALLDDAASELQLAGDDVRSIAVGVPPSALGGGRLRAAVESLAAASPQEEQWTYAMPRALREAGRDSVEFAVRVSPAGGPS